MSKNPVINIEQVEKDSVYKFDVTVDEINSSTRHIVIMEKSFYNDLNTELGPKEIVDWSFEFLLDKEPKESILSEFNIKVISNYFPEYTTQLDDFLSE